MTHKAYTLQNAQCLKQYCNKNNSIKTEKYGINTRKLKKDIRIYPQMKYPPSGVRFVGHLLLSISKQMPRWFYLSEKI
jgi:hypothetical protein